MVFKCAWSGPSISKFVKSERILQKHTLCGTICFADSLYFLVIGICTVYLFCLKPPMNYWYMDSISVLPETSNELLVYVRYICFTWNLQWTIGIGAVYLFYLEHTMNWVLIIGICTIRYICFTWNIQWTYLFYLENTMKLNALICFTWNIHWVKVILYSYLILKKMNERITDS